MSIYEFKGIKPKIGKNVFIAPNAVVLGDVILEDNVNIWFGAVLRGDLSQITIGKNSNVQDNSVVHTDKNHPVIVGENCVIGHNAILHGCRVSNNSLIGMGAILLNGSKISENSVVGAGSLVTENKIFEPNSVIVGNPAKFLKVISEEYMEEILANALRYVKNGEDFKKYLKEIEN